MKKLIFKIFKIDQMINQAYDKGYMAATEMFKEKQEEDKIRRMTINFPIGEKVICTSNSGPMVVAEVIGYEDFGHSVKLKLKDVSNGKEFITGGVVIPFDENRYNNLSKLPWWEQWNVTSSFASSLTEQEALNIQSGRPAWDNGDNK